MVVFDRRLGFGERAVTCVLVGWLAANMKVPTSHDT
jgi:hypothetical protein